MSHESQRPRSINWLTPWWLLRELGDFDLDPCAAPAPRPWPTARYHIAAEDGDGLAAAWSGRVWLNPPYNRDARGWLARLAEHGQGTALVFARTETAWFVSTVWQRATALLFLDGRVHFCRQDGIAAKNSGAPSVLIAYGHEDARILGRSGLPGAYVTGWSTTARAQDSAAQDPLPFAARGGAAA
ncbi:DNA N-6-adenine-methyltransferase [Sciscionella sediminilitoris]|uniref:DNA N-6-adenine-methyltransferase n=1 Tax=Sciscionella sediminilitoris TaxID=1445613 RepID=UPI00068BA317|nr:DNA N-6-adenine-methyltransferase [Sciscionella sp. SE31]